MHNPGDLDGYSQWAAVEAAVNGVAKLRPTVESLRELNDLVNHVRVHRDRCRRLVRRCFHLVHKAGSFPQKMESSEPDQVFDRLYRCCSAIRDDMREWAKLGYWKSWPLQDKIKQKLVEHEWRQKHCGELIELAIQVHDNMAITKEPLTRRSVTTGPSEKGERHEDEHESATEGSAPTLDPSTKSALSLTTGSYKWVKFITVVPGQHGRFRIHAGTPPIFGGFSDVWRCDARFSDGRVTMAAVKKFRAVRIARDVDANTVTNKLLKRLTKELDIWMALQHPHISPLLGFVLEDDLCIISPWYTNGNVAEYIDRHPEVDRIKLVSDVASGLAYLHSRVLPVVHGDMKADNVLIDDAGNAVIIDFGLSAIVEDDPTLTSSLAATSSALQDAGNARWMAPELLMEEGCTRSSSTDVYSFGCVALQIYTGEIPFKDVPTFRIVYALIQGQKPLAKREDYPATALSSPSLNWFYDLLVSCWDGSPTVRPSMVDVESKLRMGVLSSGVSGTCT